MHHPGPYHPGTEHTGPQPPYTTAAPATAPPGPARRLGIGDLLCLTGGAIVFGFSFAPFVSYSDRLVNDVSKSASRDFDGWYMAWSTQMFMAPLTWWVIIAAVLAAVLSGLRLATGRHRSLLRFGDAQLQVGLGLFAFLVLIGYALSHKQIWFGLDEVISTNRFLPDYRPSFAWGGILMLLGALTVLVGAVLNHLDVGLSVAARIGQTPAGHQDVPGQPGADYTAPAQPGVGYTVPGQPFPGQQSAAFPPDAYPPTTTDGAGIRPTQPPHWG